MPNQPKETNNTVITIPQFMSEQNDALQLENTNTSTSKLYKVMLSISIVWAVIVVIYITQFFGWSNLFLMMPEEFGGFLAGITLPLAVIWIVLAYMDRGASFKQEAKLLHSYMNQLVYPEDGAAQTSKAMADAIRAQVIELRQATKEATEETAKIKNELNQHIADFSKLVNILQGYSGTTMKELNEGVQIMSQGLDYINDKINVTTTDIENKIGTLTNTVDVIQSDINAATNSLENQMNGLKETTVQLHNLYADNNNIVTMNSEMVNNCSNQLNNDFKAISDFISQQSDRFVELNKQINNNYQYIYDQIQDRAQQLEHNLTNQANNIIDSFNSISDTTLIASEKFDEFRSNINKEVDNIITRSQTIADCVELQVQNLSELSNSIRKDIDKTETYIGEKIQYLEQTSNQAAERINSTFDSLDDKVDTLRQNQEMIIENSKIINAEFNNCNDNLITKINYTKDQSQQLCEEINTCMHTLCASGDDLLDSLGNIDNHISQQANNLQKITENIETQNKLNTTSFEQQHKLLNNALAKIETAKNVIKQQMEEILNISNSIDDSSISTMKQMEIALTDNLEKSQQIITNTSEATDVLQKQIQTFENASDKAVAKVIDFSTQIKDSQDNMEALITDIVGKAENVATIIEAQVKAVNTTTANTTNKHNKLLELFNQQSSILNNTAENTINYVADVVQTLDEKAETINMLFKNQQNEFFNICDKIADNSSHIGNTLKNQISLLEQGSNRIFNRMSSFEEEFTKKTNLLTSTSNQTIDKLSSITDELDRQNNQIDKSVEGISNKMSNINKEVSNYLDVFQERIDAIKNESSTAGNKISDTCNQLKDIHRTILVDSQNINQSIENQIKEMDGNISKINGQSEQIANNLNKQKDSIADVINLISTQTRLGEASLAQQYKYLCDATTDVNAKIQEIEKNFQDNSEKIFEQSNKLAFEINSLSDKLIKASEDVQKTTKNSVKELQSVGIGLSNITDTVIENVTATNKAVDGVINKYQNNIASFNTVTAEASSGFVEVNNIISQQNDKMIKISEDTKNLVNSFNVVLNEASNQLTKRANSAYNQIKEMSEQMKKLSLQLEDSTQLTAKHMNDAGDKMRANIHEIATNAERISNEIRSSGEVFIKQTSVLSQSTTDTIDKVSQAMNLLKVGSENLSVKGKMWIEQSDEFVKVFERQAEIIDTTSLKATENLRKLESKFQEVQTDSFLNDAATLFERMETIAIDINKIFNPTAEEEIWKKYYQGDTSVFVRHLTKVMTKNQIAAIRKEYEDNSNFRSLVNRYVADFEMLISKAKGNERSGVLLSVISGSDVGKIYYIMAKALDKLN